MDAVHDIIGLDRSPAAILPQVLPTPTHGAGAWMTVASSTCIAVPPETCLQVLLNAAEYPQWNRFVRRVEIVKEAPPPPPPLEASSSEAPPFRERGPGLLALGTDMIFYSWLDTDSADDSGSKAFATALQVSVLGRLEDLAASDGGGGKKGWRVAWCTTTADMPAFLLRCERVQDLVEDGEGGTLYFNWESFRGLLAPVMRWVTGRKLLAAFGVWMAGLKSQAETKAQGGARGKR